MDFVLTGGPAPVRTLTWTGTDPSNPTFWDIGTSVNWVDTGNGNVAATYQQAPNGDFVTFNDSATGSTTVNVTTGLSPGSLTVSNNSLTYIFNGSGPISGIAGLTKQGIGMLLVDENNTCTGANILSRYTVQVGTNDGQGTLGGGTINNTGALVFDRSASSPLLNDISGNGPITQMGGDVLTLSGTNTSYTGTILVISNATVSSPSILQLGNNSALGAGTLTTVSNTCTLDLNGFSAAGNLVVQGYRYFWAGRN